jgi:hypothetical protein
MLKTILCLHHDLRLGPVKSPWPKTTGRKQEVGGAEFGDGTQISKRTASIWGPGSTPLLQCTNSISTFACPKVSHL